MQKLRYMHRNPVTRGLVLEPEQWRWSSYRYYAYGEAGAVLVNDLLGSGNEVCAQSSGVHPSKSAKGGAAKFGVKQRAGQPPQASAAHIACPWMDR
jgi:hypothetical protein